MASTVNQYLARLFLKNETQTTKWTDQEIANLMGSRFPATAASRVEKIGIRRSYFNANAEAFEGMNPDGVVSAEYDKNGNIVPPAKIIRKRVEIVGGLSEERVRAIVQEEQAKSPSITISVPERKHEIKLEGGTYHKSFAKAFRKLSAGIPVMLVGPAGSGKTTLAAQLAKAMGLSFSFNSMSAGTKETDILGRTLPDSNGNWVYRPSPFVETYQNGGLHLFDEIDAADSNLLVSINAALANRLLSVPFRDDNTPIVMNPSAYIIAAANTFGNGANRMYVGRNQLDAATLNRYTMGTLTVDYDRDLEMSMATATLNSPERAEILCNWAWGIRDAIDKNSLRRIMSTRNIIDSCKLLLAGEEMSDLKQTFAEGWSADEKRICGLL